MKKLKANSILAAFVLGTSLLMLCSFGTDAAYIVLSRYKLQKITEAVAIEFASNKAKDYENKKDTESEVLNACNSVINKYENIYNVTGSGVMVFNIEGMEYKANRETNEVVVKTSTTSKVLPAFLRFVGVREIYIHANAYAKSNRITIEKTMQKYSAEEAVTSNFRPFSIFAPAYAVTIIDELDSSAKEDEIISTEKFINIENAMVEFEAPFKDDNSVTSLVSAKNNGKADFTIEFKYDTESALDEGGGFFIFAGHPFGLDSSGNVKYGWVDIGNLAANKTKNDIQKVCINSTSLSSKCFYCVNAAKDKITSFNLTNQLEGLDDTKGRINRFTKLRIYKAAASGEKDPDTGLYKNPCSPSFATKAEDGTVELPYFDYINRDAKVTFTILNNVSLIKKNEYNNFAPKEFGGDDDTQGQCSCNSTEY